MSEQKGNGVIHTADAGKSQITQGFLRLLLDSNTIRSKFSFFI